MILNGPFDFISFGTCDSNPKSHAQGNLDWAASLDPRLRKLRDQMKEVAEARIRGRERKVQVYAVTSAADHFTAPANRRNKSFN